MAAILYQFLFISLFPFLNSSTPDPISKTAPHPFYISVTEVNQNAKDQTLEISCKMFADDFEQILEKNYKKELDISTEKDKPVFDKIIPDYMTKHLSFVIDSRPVHFTYVGYEKDKESVYCYLQIDKVPSVKKIDINNSILHDFNDTQINIMHVIINGHRQSTKLDYPNTAASFVF